MLAPKQVNAAAPSHIDIMGQIASLRIQADADVESMPRFLARINPGAGRAQLLASRFKAAAAARRVGRAWEDLNKPDVDRHAAELALKRARRAHADVEYYLEEGAMLMPPAKIRTWIDRPKYTKSVVKAAARALECGYCPGDRLATGD